MLYDKEATKAAGFLDPRSYIKRAKDGENLTFLFGLDMEALRKRVFEHSKGFCQMPVRGFTAGVRCNRNISWETSEMHHSPSLSQGGDDSEDGVLMICRRCHVAAHNRTTRWKERNASDRAKILASSRRD